jgi:hypothetical protein
MDDKSFPNGFRCNLEEAIGKPERGFKFDLDIKFWAITPLFSLNLHAKCVEFEFLCFSIYYRYG